MKIIVLISGKLGSGKNTLAAMLAVSMAGTEKTVVTDMFAADLKALTAKAFKPLAKILKGLHNSIAQIAQPEWLQVKGYPLISKLILKDENFYEEKTEISRALLQIVGTDIGRVLGGTTCWVDMFLERTMDEDFDIKIVTDTRFSNEIDILKQMADTEEDLKVVSIRVNRDLALDPLISEHSSETALDGYTDFDYTVNNNGSKQALEEAAVAIAHIITSKHTED